MVPSHSLEPFLHIFIWTHDEFDNELMITTIAGLMVLREFCI